MGELEISQARCAWLESENAALRERVSALSGTESAPAAVGTAPGSSITRRSLGKVLGAAAVTAVGTIALAEGPAGRRSRMDPMS